MTETTPPKPVAPRASVLRWVARALTFASVLVAAALVAAWVFVNSQASVGFAVREMVARSDGRLEVEGATGSLWHGIEVRRLHWRGPSSNAVADGIALTWSPIALLRRGILVHAFAAQHVELDVVASDSPVAPPVTLALPFEITIERAAIGRLDWHVGENRGTIEGLTFAYAGGAKEHRVSALSLAALPGTVTGETTIGADAPFPIGGNLAFAGTGTHRNASATLNLSGTLSALVAEGRGRIDPAQGAFRVELTPLGAIPLSKLTIDATDIDLAAWDKTLPTTRIGLAAHAVPAEGGLTGHVEATNTADGNLDTHRVPLATLAANFTWQRGTVTLDDLVADLTGGGHASGRARIPLAGGGAEGTWWLDVRNVNLRRLYAPMIATQLRGSINAELEAGRQRVVVDVADRDVAGGLFLQATAVVADGRVDVERFRARAMASELAGRGSVRHSGDRAFSIDAVATHFDPSRFGDFPAGNLDGTIKASGALAPAWHVDAQVAIAPGSKLSGVAISGTARGDATRETLRNAAIDLALGSAKVKATGSAGAATDRLTITLDAPRLADLVPLLPPQVPRALAGSLHAKADVTGLYPRGGIDLDAKGEALRLGPALALGSIDVHVAIPPAAASSGDADFASRAIAIVASATKIVAPNGTFATASASVDGLVGEHKAILALKGDDFDATATAFGGLRNVGAGASIANVSWSGLVDTLQNRGAWPLRLASPVTLTVSRQQVAVGGTRIEVADGNVELKDFTWDEGRIASHGSFTAVPLASAAHLAGVALPFASTLALGGAWSIAAAPRLNGTVEVRREGGDLFMQREGTTNGARIPVGITALELAGRFTDDAVDATATFRSSPSGSADAKLAIGVAPNAPPGRISPDAPLTLAATADLATLQLLQPWVGTTAVVDGRAHAELSARGTVRRAPFAGSVRADGIRIDAPQYGVHYTDGIIALHLVEGRIVLDDIQLTAGAGKFRASGAMAAAAGDTDAPTARLAWHADKFKAFNRPDLHLVVDGDGTVALQDKKLSLTGKLRAEEGRIVYVSDPNATLGNDVVVKGWSRPASMAAFASDVPLAVDLELDFGTNLTFASQGLDTGLQGTVRVTSNAGGFGGKGSLRAVNGTYFAFGQKLAIDPGRLIFDGPLDNPGLDIVAMRKNLAVEAGVAVTGTVKVPIIALTSNPPMTDGEKLSWLVLGQGLDRTSSSTDLAALQAASAALFGRNAKPVTTTIAQSIGLDDITFKSGTAVPASSSRSGLNAGGQVVALGKRLTENLTLVYEQGLTVATNALRIEYSITRSVTLRAEAGTVSGAGIYYRRSFE